MEAFNTSPSLRFPRQGRFHPMKYLQGLSKAIQRCGGKILGGTHVKDVETGSPVLVRTDAGPTVRAGTAAQYGLRNLFKAER